jgi:choice-of-anchor A domain-containing protein
MQLSHSWKGLMAAGLMALTAACGGAASQDATQGNGQGAALMEAAKEPGVPPSSYSSMSAQKQAMVTAMASANPLAPVITESGFIRLSVDGIGTNAASGVVQANKPSANATVKAAYMAAASTGFSSYQIPNGGVKIDGQNVTWSRTIPSGISSYNHWADVTSLVASKLNAAPAGRVNFTITESNTTSVDGEILAVIFNDPTATTVNTVILLFGSQSTTGDLFRIGLASPINKNDPNLGLDLSLGISFGYQTGTTAERQISLIDVNGQRLTSQAGGQDDGANEDGALLTVGGLDDSNANPAPTAQGPGPHADDELYDLLPFVTQGSTQISIFTQNPSNDDNIFFGALNLTSAVAVIGEGIVLAPATSSGPAGTTHTVTATLQDSNGQPLSGRTVTFTVTTGPNAGRTGTAVADSQGHASFTYTGSTTAGRDEIQASFVKTNGQTGVSNSAFRDWTALNRAPTASCSNIVLNAGPSCGASGSVNNGSSDPDGDAINCTQSPAGPYGEGTTNVTLTCTDSKGASASCTATVQVVDTTGPMIQCPTAFAAECVNGAATVNTGAANATDNCGEVIVNNPPPASYPLGDSVVTYTATDSAGNQSTCHSEVTVVDTQAPVITLAEPAAVTLACGEDFYETGYAATDACEGDLTANVEVSGGVDPWVSGEYALNYSVTDSAGHTGTATRIVTVGPCNTCIDISLNDYNLFLLGDYTGGHDVVGKVAAGGNITMDNFAVGSGLDASDTDNVLVAGGNLTLSNGGVYGDAHYGGSYSANQTVTFPRGSASQGTPIDFAARGAQLLQLSQDLANQPLNGTYTRTNWGGLYVHGTDSSLNVVSFDASDFNGAVLFNIDAPAGSMVVVNITGASASFSGFGISFSGGIDQQGVLYNFVDATSITAQGFGFWGTVLAPNADITFTNGSFDGGIYAKSLSGNAEGHINPLRDYSLCTAQPHN